MTEQPQLEGLPWDDYQVDYTDQNASETPKDADGGSGMESSVLPDDHQGRMLL